MRSKVYVPTLVSPTGVRTFLRYTGTRAQYHLTVDPMFADHWVGDPAKTFDCFKNLSKGITGSENWQIYMIDNKNGQWDFGFKTFRQLVSKGYWFALTRITTRVVKHDAHLDLE